MGVERVVAFPQQGTPAENGNLLPGAFRQTSPPGALAAPRPRGRPAWARQWVPRALRRVARRHVEGAVRQIDPEMMQEDRRGLEGSLQGDRRQDRRLTRQP